MPCRSGSNQWRRSTRGPDLVLGLSLIAGMAATLVLTASVRNVGIVAVALPPAWLVAFSGWADFPIPAWQVMVGLLAGVVMWHAVNYRRPLLFPRVGERADNPISRTVDDCRGADHSCRRDAKPLRNGLLHSIADDRRFHGQCHSMAGPYCRNITGACFCVRVGYGATNELATDSRKSELVSANHFAVAVSSVARRLPPCTLGSQPSRHTGPLTETHPGRLGRVVGPLR